MLDLPADMRETRLSLSDLGSLNPATMVKASRTRPDGREDDIVRKESKRRLLEPSSQQLNIVTCVFSHGSVAQ